MIELVFFIIAFFLSISNGFLFTRVFEKKISWNLLPVYIVVGIIITTLVVYFFRLLDWPFWVVELLSLVLFISQYKKTFSDVDFKFPIHIEKIVFIPVTTIILGSIGFFQGYKNGNLIIFSENAHDGLWHIALQRSLINSLPPENPIYEGEILKGYHYFADLYGVHLSQVSNLSPEIIYLNIMPFVLSFLFAISALSVFSFFVKDRVITFLLSGILCLSSGFAFFVPFIFPGGSNNQSAFWLDQPVGYIINPHLLLSFSVINILILLIFSDARKWKILIGILLGSLVVIKVYAFLIFSPLVGIFALYKLKNRDSALFVSCIIAFLLSLLLVLSSQISNGFPFIYEPGWFIKSMFESSDHLNYSKWELERQTFAVDNNLIHLIFHWSYGLAVFLLGNFGLKIMGVIFCLFILFKKNAWETKEKILFCSGTVFISILIPLLFLQKGVVWSSIQFLHFAQLSLGLLILWGTNLMKKRWQYLILGLILLMGLPTTINAFINTVSPSRYNAYPLELINGLENLKIINTKTRFIITHHKDTSLVSAISGKSIYYADPNMLSILQIDYSKRLENLSEIENNSLCPIGFTLITIPQSTAPGRIMFQNKALKIVECNK